MTLHTLNQYGHDFQIKVISSLLTHKDFLTNIHDIISEEYFENSAHRWAIKEILNYYDKYHHVPTLEVLKVELQKVDNEVLQIAIKEQLKTAYVSSDDDLKYVQEEFTNFCRNQQLKKALMSSVDMLKAGDFEGIRYLVEGALKAGQDKNVGHEYIKDLEERYREDTRTTIETPWPKINDILQGGLGNGDFGLIFGSPGGGKSWSLVALAGNAVKMGFNVVYYTLELGEDYVGRRFDAHFTKIPANEIMMHKEKVQEVMTKLPGNLIIKEFPPNKASMSTIESHIQKCEDLGTKIDLVVIDYVDLLRSKKTSKERKEEIDDIYISTKALARELNIPIWSASQVNRQGAQDEIIEGHKAAGSYDKMMITDFAASISRRAKDKQTGVGKLHIMKNRYGMDGLTYNAAINIAIGEYKIINDAEFEELAGTPEYNSNEAAKISDNFNQSEKNQLRNLMNS